MKIPMLVTIPAMVCMGLASVALAQNITNKLGNNTTATFKVIDDDASGNKEILVLEAKDQASESPNIIGGHNDNSVTSGAYGATVGGGGWTGSDANIVTDDFGTVGGGSGNLAGDNAGTTDDRLYATVGGGAYNEATGTLATVGGGHLNWADGYTATVGGGVLNWALGDTATVGGGFTNWATHDYATVGGGYWNWATDDYATVGGGFENTASGKRATVGGGSGNEASGKRATVGGGALNTASGKRATVGGGLDNRAKGDNATVPGGRDNRANGEYSFAAGASAKAKAAHGYSFVWNDRFGTVGGSTAANQVIFYYGGAGLNCHVEGTAASWTCTSDRAMKENFVSVDGTAILDALVAMPVAEYNMKGADPSVRRMGPVAQEFYAAFGLGKDDKGISSMDAIGVTMAAVQGLYAVVQEKDAALKAQEALLQAQERALEAQQREIEGLKTEMAHLRHAAVDRMTRNAALEARFERLEQVLAPRMAQTALEMK